MDSFPSRTPLTLEIGPVLCAFPSSRSCFWSFCAWISSSLSWVGRWKDTSETESVPRTAPRDGGSFLPRDLYPWFQGMPWAAPVTVSWGCDLRPHRGACLCVNWVEDVVGKPSQFCGKANAPISSKVNFLGCERAERCSAHSQRQRAPPPHPQPLWTWWRKALMSKALLPPNLSLYGDFG